MKSLMNDIAELETLIRELHKIDSKLLAGQIIPAWRDNRRIIALLEKNRNSLLSSINEEQEEENEK